MKKALKWTGIVVVVLVAVLLGVAALCGGRMVCQGVNAFGPQVLGVPVTLEGATFRPLAGTIKLRNLQVGNPQGFNTPALFDLGAVNLELNSRSLFSDTIVIHKVEVVAPHITYEKSLRGSNISALMKQLQGAEKKAAEQPAAAKTPAQPGPAKKVVIEELVVSDPALNVSITAAGGHYVPVKLGRVEIKDIGKEHGGATFADALAIVISVITGNIENAVAGAGDLLVSGAKGLGQGAQAVGGTVGDGASAVIKGVGGLFGGDKKNGGKK
jgi:uncharacterized protein involved in outer membrane biogenesis